VTSATAGRLASDPLRHFAAMVALETKTEASHRICEAPPREKRSTTHHRCT